MRGAAPAPTGLKLLKGVRPARINQNEPKPKSVSGNIPRGWALHMSDIAKRFWKQNGPRLAAAGILTDVDLYAFRILCELYASWVQLINKIRKEGEVYQTVNQQKQKVWKKHPGVAIREDIEKRLIQYFAQFGMVPSGRSRIALPPEIPGDDEDLI